MDDVILCPFQHYFGWADNNKRLCVKEHSLRFRRFHLQRTARSVVSYLRFQLTGVQ